LHDEIKAKAEELEALFDRVNGGRYCALALTPLEEAVMLCAKELTSGAFGGGGGFDFIGRFAYRRQCRHKRPAWEVMRPVRAPDDYPTRGDFSRPLGRGAASSRG